MLADLILLADLIGASWAQTTTDAALSFFSPFRSHPATRRADPSAGRRPAAKSAAKPLPEVHVLGEITGGTGFGDRAVCCKWSIECGDKWEWLGGHRQGQTHTADPDGGSDLAVWAHPLDVHFAAGEMSVSRTDDDAARRPRERELAAGSEDPPGAAASRPSHPRPLGLSTRRAAS